MKQSHYVPVACALALMVPVAAFFATTRETNAAPAAPANAAKAVGAEKVVTEADNGSEVTLNPGDVLVVRLKESPATGYSRALVTFPDMPIRLLSQRTLAPAAGADDDVPMVGAPKTGEWKFVVSGEATYG